jgi:acyl carrier protein
MNRIDVFATVKEIINEIIEDVPAESITESAHLQNDLGADSLQMVEILSKSSKTLRIKVKRADLMKTNNLGELVSLYLDCLKSQMTNETSPLASA